jgi:hypothetical protein
MNPTKSIILKTYTVFKWSFVFPALWAGVAWVIYSQNRSSYIMDYPGNYFDNKTYSNMSTHDHNFMIWWHFYMNEIMFLLLAVPLVSIFLAFLFFSTKKLFRREPSPFVLKSDISALVSMAGYFSIIIALLAYYTHRIYEIIHY